MRHCPAARPVLRAILLTLSGILAACGDTPTEQRRALLGSAYVTLMDSTGVYEISDVDAAFYVYNVGPYDVDRAMYLVLATPERRPSAIELELFQFLPDLQEMPLEGTFPVAGLTLGETTTMSGSLRVWSDTTRKLLQSHGGSVTVHLVTPDSITGNLHVELVGTWPGHGPVTINSTFKAVRVAQFEELPRAR